MKRIRKMALPLATTLCVSTCDAPREPLPSTLEQGVRGVIHYRGNREGTLHVAAFSSFPPRGAPLAQIEIRKPQFPQEYVLPRTQSGRVFVLAVLDVDETDGDNYHPSVDPGGAYGSYRFPETVTVGDTQLENPLSIELVDPSLDSPWSRPGYR